MRPRLAIAALVLAAAALRTSAQTCPCPPTLTPGWHGNAGAGLAITSGNSDTQSYNLALLTTYDPKTRNIIRIDGLYLKAKAEGEDTTDKSAFGVRDEYKFGRSFLFGELRYQRDRFKLLDSLIAPIVGAGYKLIDLPEVMFAVDAGIGIAREKLRDRDATTDGALRAGESLLWKLSDTASFTHLASALWKLDDFGDAFYHIEAGLAASLNARLELKLGALVDIKNQPAQPTLSKTDKALLASVVFKF